MEKRPSTLINVVGALALSSMVLLIKPVESFAQDPEPETEQPEVTPEEASPYPLKDRYTTEDTLAALANASPLAKCIVYYEVGRGGNGYGPWDPNAIGSQGEKGMAQLHPQGKLNEFYAEGYDNPFNPYQAETYLEDALKRGQSRHWTSVRYGWCR